MEAVLDIIRLTVGLCFCVSAWKKALSFSSFQVGISTFRIIPDSWTAMVGGLIILTETILSLSFLSTVFLQQLCVMALLIMLVFGCVSLSARLRGIETACLCFGADGSEGSSPKGWLRWALLTTGVLVVCCMAWHWPNWEGGVVIAPWNQWVAAASMLVACMWLIELGEPSVGLWRGNSLGESLGKPMSPAPWE